MPCVHLWLCVCAAVCTHSHMHTRIYVNAGEAVCHSSMHAWVWLCVHLQTYVHMCVCVVVCTLHVSGRSCAPWFCVLIHYMYVCMCVTAYNQTHTVALEASQPTSGSALGDLCCLGPHAHPPPLSLIPTRASLPTPANAAPPGWPRLSPLPQEACKSRGAGLSSLVPRARAPPGPQLSPLSSSWWTLSEPHTDLPVPHVLRRLFADACVSWLRGPAPAAGVC